MDSGTRIPLRRPLKTFIYVLLLAAGVAASLSLTQAHADAVTLQDLPGLGYSLILRFDVPSGCGNYVVVSGNGASETLIGDPVHDWCQLPGAIAARIAALVALYPPVSSTAAPVTVTVTTFETTTVAAPSVTVTVPVTSTATLERTTASTVERTVAAPVQTVVRTETVAPAATVAAPVVLNVDGASAQAFAAAMQMGADGAAAALAARSAGLNVTLGLV